MALDVHLFAGCRRHGIDYGRNVLILTFQAVLRSIAAGTSASPIDCINRDVWLQVGEQWPPSSVVGGWSPSGPVMWYSTRVVTVLSLVGPASPSSSQIHH